MRTLYNKRDGYIQIFPGRDYPSSLEFNPIYDNAAPPGF